MTSAHDRKGITMIPTTEIARIVTMGAKSSSDSMPTTAVASGRVASVLAAAVTALGNATAITTLSSSTIPTIVQTHGRPGTITRPHSKPRVNHGRDVAHRLTELGRADHHVLTAWRETRRRLERAADNGEIMLEPGAGHDRDHATDDDNLSLDHSRGLEAQVAEDDHDVAEHLTGNRRVGHDDHGVANRRVLAEVER